MRRTKRELLETLKVQQLANSGPEGVGTGGRLGVHGCQQQWQGRVQEGWVTPGLMTSLDYHIRK
jgi:hypothetical protein